MEILITISIFAIIAGLFYLAIREQARISSKIEKEILNHSKENGLTIKRIICPDTSHWKYSPFEDEIKIGTLGFHGIPTNEEYFRILVHVDPLTREEKHFWLKAINNRKTKKFSFEWREEAVNPLSL